MINGMEHILIIIGLALMGLVLGSFCGATVWRLRARQLEEDKDAGEKIDQKEYSRLKKILKKPTTEDRSICLHCHHQLAWYDLLPLVSWVALRGKCRYCHRPIGVMEPLIELGTALFFIASYVWWPLPLDSPLQITQLVLWLIAGVGLVILTAYDIRWFLLPNRVVYPVLVLAGVSALLHIIQAPDVGAAVLSLVWACAILSGLYFVLYLVSKGSWIGFGDIKLGLVLALLVADWQLAFLTLFLANVIGCLVVLPGLGTKKFNRYTRIPFGPMLIAGCFIAMLFGERIITWYLTSFSLV
jgi:leader peptidase (prepilin peptidase)/N-methyltransferase